MSMWIKLAVIVLNAGNILVALLLDAIGYVGVQFGANDNPLRQGPVSPSWLLIAQVILLPVIAIVLFPLPAFVLMKRGARLVALGLSGFPCVVLLITSGFWWPGLKAFVGWR